MSPRMSPRGYTGRDIYPGYVMGIDVSDSELEPFDAAFPRFGLHVVKQGTRVVDWDGRSITLTAPSALLLDASRPRVLRDFDAVTLTLWFDPAVVNASFTVESLSANQFTGTDYQDRYLLTPFLGEGSRVVALGPTLFRQVVQGIQKIEREGSEQRDGSWPCRTRTYLIELLFHLRLEAPETGDLAGDTPADLVYSRALSDVRTRFTEPLSVEELARNAGTNRTTLNNEFRRRTGHSVHSYVIALRLDLAATLLRDTRLSVAEITPRVGYEDQSHFGRLFRRWYGVAPAEYRDRSQSGENLSSRTRVLSFASGT